jgi:[ribosomal protein S18]-alanine N-acetyltransferase
VKVEPWTEAHACEVETWHYEPPYDFYDLASDPDDAAAMHDPARSARTRAVLGDDGRLDAFWSFKVDGDVVEVGIGLRPGLTGRGLGEAFLRAQLEFARESWNPERFRLYVAEWNQRAIRLYERLGFREVGRETRNFELVGQHEFVKMECSA